MAAGLRISQVNGLSTAVSLTKTDGSAVAVYTDATLATTVTMPATITTTTTFWVAASGLYSLSVKPNGYEVADPTKPLNIPNDGFNFELPRDAATLAHIFAAGSGSGGSSSTLAPLAAPVTASTFTAAVSTLVPVDTTANAVAVTLPTAPADGKVIEVKIVTRPGTNNVTVSTGGSDVFNKAGGATSLTLSVLGQFAKMTYAASTGVWFVEEGVSVTQTDLRYPQTVNGRAPVSGAVTLLATDLSSITTYDPKLNQIVRGRARAWCDNGGRRVRHRELNRQRIVVRNVDPTTGFEVQYSANVNSNYNTPGGAWTLVPAGSEFVDWNTVNQLYARSIGGVGPVVILDVYVEVAA